MKFDFPWGAKVYCRMCHALESHRADGAAGVRCLVCDSMTLAVEIATVYSFDDEYADDPVLSLPMEQYPPAVREHRLRTPEDDTT